MGTLSSLEGSQEVHISTQGGQDDHFSAYQRVNQMSLNKIEEEAKMKDDELKQRLQLP